jgi:DNA-binding transcriptional LysR family regulator
MSIRHLPYFVVVAEEQNLRRAAERLGLTISALSRRMQDLEHELGVELFIRHRTGITLTAAGEAYRDDVHRIMDRLTEAGTRVGRITRGEVGNLRVGFNAIAFRQRFLGEALQLFSARSPDVHLELKPAISSAQLEALRDDLLDVGLLSGPVDDDAFESLHFQDFPMLLTFNDSHRLMQSKTVALADLIDEKTIWFTRASSPVLYDRMMGEFRAAGVAPRIIFETISAATICDLISFGAGVGFVSGSFERGLPAGLQQRRVSDFDVSLSFCMVWKKARTDTLLRRFIDTVVAVRAAQSGAGANGPA